MKIIQIFKDTINDVEVRVMPFRGIGLKENGYEIVLSNVKIKR
jgi:hypothetical protein